MYYTNNGNELTGALSTINVNGSVYQLGKDASATDGGIMKLFSAFEANKTAVDGTYTAKAVYDEIKALKDTVNGTDGESLDDKILAATTEVATASGETYLTLVESAGANGQKVYTLGTTGIDSAISTAIQGVLGQGTIAEAYDTIKEIADWITADSTGAAAIIAQVGGKADKVANATAGNFAGLDANGNLTDSGSKAADFATAAQGSKADSAIQSVSINGAAVTPDANKGIDLGSNYVQDANYVHTDNNYTTAEKNKLAAITAVVNGDTLTLTTQAA